MPTPQYSPANATGKSSGGENRAVQSQFFRLAQGVAQLAERPVKEVEFEAFAEAAEELGSDQPDGDFFARALPKAVWDAPWMSPIKRVVLAHRLREVVAQVGFTRFESLGADINGELRDELTLNIKAAAIARDADWLPAIENRGEGVFLLFDALRLRPGCKMPLSKTV